MCIGGVTKVIEGSNRLHSKKHIQRPGFGQSSANIHVNSAKNSFFFFSLLFLSNWVARVPELLNFTISRLTY